MREANFTVASVHGEMDSRERETITTAFRNGDYRVLITTDLWARGLDVKQVSLVINYDVPINKEVYLHRIGRTGRYGKTGVAVSFVTDSEFDAIHTLEQYYATKILEMPANIAALVDVPQ